ncbi:DUF6183 family protein [Actinomadura sp. 3N508]|uniref:DUF6183 family protein n=1 Tax=Actinomadura sp. 3N508 TaxID=3375153 RepID=UPI0037918F75
MEIAEAVRRMGLANTYKDPHWNRAVKVTDNTVQKAAPEWLEALLGALLQVTRPTYPMRYGFEVALRRLALAPGDADRVANVRALAVQGRAWADVRYGLPEVAELLACGQPPEHLLAVFDDADPADELAACLLQETALRHDATSATEFAERLRAAGHPLADLPLRPAPAEREHALTAYPEPPKPAWCLPGDDAPEAPGPPGLAIAAEAVDWPDSSRARSAFRDWTADAEDIEARLFRLGRPIAAGEFGSSLLSALPAASTGPAVTGVRRVTTADVLRRLFGAAAGGGAYGPGMHGAYARRASWESLAALADVQEFNVTAIEEAADRCGWLFYTSDWHMRIIPTLDVGIAALRPDRRTVAVLAATDAD